MNVIEQLRNELARKNRELAERDSYIAQLEAALNDRYEVIESLESQLERTRNAAAAAFAQRTVAAATTTTCQTRQCNSAAAKQKRVAISAESSAHKQRTHTQRRHRQTSA